MNDTRRLFIASFLKDSEKENLKSVIEANEDLIASYKTDARLVGPLKWHLTWMFLGDCNKELENQIIDLLEETSKKCSSQQIVYDKFSIWPSSKRPRVGVLESSKPPVEFILAVEQMQKKLSPMLLNPGEQHAKFNPHITIARFKNKCFEQSQFNMSRLPFTQNVDDVALVISDFKTYSILEQFQLRPE